MPEPKSISLYYTQGSSDKEYHVQLLIGEVSSPNGWVVNFQYGRRGSSLNWGTKTPEPLEYDKAEKVYNKLVGSKIGKGYTEDPSGIPGSTHIPPKPTQTGSQPAAVRSGAPTVITVPPVTRRILWQEDTEPLLPQLLNEIEEDELESYLTDDSWGAQEKKDGKHLMIRKTGVQVIISNKKGKEIGNADPHDIGGGDMVLDAEGIGQTFHVFDLLEHDGKSYRELGYRERHMKLAGLSLGDAVKVVPLAVGTRAKRSLIKRLRDENREGIVFKRLDAPYRPGRPNKGGDMVKFKFYAEASVIATAGRSGKRSVGMQVYKDGVLTDVGNVTIPPNKDVPEPGAVIEVRYLYAYRGGSLYQPTYKEPRDDVGHDECVETQLKYKAEEQQ